MKKAMLTILLALFAGSVTRAQKQCGHQAYIHYLETQNPGFKAAFATARKEALASAETYRQLADMAPLSKTTASPVIPVVFHVILDAGQLAEIGGASGVEARIKSQVRVLNEDFNALNADVSKVPAVWKSRVGKIGLQFGLAHTDPDGNRTEGFEIRVVGAPASFAFGDGCKAAKTFATGGLDPWDNDRYLNIWIVNIQGSGLVVGITAPPGPSGFPAAEKGVALFYKSLGVRTSPAEVFLRNTDLGRTLTHELGHYFYLWHTFGDDDGKCPGDPGGDDDGIADTPPEAGPVYGAPTFPVFDACSDATTNGVMFMNYLDYTNDLAMYMFTNGQADVVNGQLSSSGYSYTLTQHPELIDYPPVSVTETGNAGSTLVLSPNPAHDQIRVTGPAAGTISTMSVSLINMIGQTVLQAELSPGATLDVSALPRGSYVLRCKLEHEIVTKKIVLE